MIESAILCPRPQLQQSSDPDTPHSSHLQRNFELRILLHYFLHYIEDMYGDPVLLFPFIIPSQHWYDRSTASANCADIYEIKNADFPPC